MREWSYGHYVCITQPSAGGLPSAVMQDTGESGTLLSSRRAAQWKGEAQMLTVPHDPQKAGPSPTTKACPVPLRCSGLDLRCPAKAHVSGEAWIPDHALEEAKQAVPGEAWGKAAGTGEEEGIVGHILGQLAFSLLSHAPCHDMLSCQSPKRNGAG